MKWILFHQIFSKNCNFFVCPTCKKHIQTGHLFNFDFIYIFFLGDIFITILGLIILYYLFGLFTTIALIVGYFIIFTLLFLLQQYIVPLELSYEIDCKEKGLTRIQAFFALLLMISIITFTVYELFVKPVFLNQAPLS